VNQVVRDEEFVVDGAAHTTRSPLPATTRDLAPLHWQAGWSSETQAMVRQARHVLTAQKTEWIPAFAAICDRAGRDGVPDPAVLNVATACWAFGHADISAVLTLALISQPTSVGSATSDVVWPFLDLGCDDATAWALARHALVGTDTTEAWFSWVVSMQSWELLPAAAKTVPAGSEGHFGYLATCATEPRRTYADAESEYDYGRMITPWNNLHLSWLAIRLGDADAAISHARKLCSTAMRGDQRAGRFLTKLSAWSIFAGIRHSQPLQDEIEAARHFLGMVPTENLPHMQRRVEEIWRHILKP
jgi:hypothetical protein